MAHSGASSITVRRRARLTVEPLESRELLDAGLVHHVAPLLTDPTGHADGMDRISWSDPGTPATVHVFLNTRSGANKLASRDKELIRAALAELNKASDGNAGLQLVEVFKKSEAQISVQEVSTSRIGGVAQGVLGVADYYAYKTSERGRDGRPFYRFVGPQFGNAYQVKVNIISGWNWYTGQSPSRIGRRQYDYRSVVTHELAHAVGLDHDTKTYGKLNGDGRSSMFPYVLAGRPRRRLSPGDVASLKYLYGQRSPPPGGGGKASGNAALTGDDHPEDGQNISLDPRGPDLRAFFATAFISAPPLGQHPLPGAGHSAGCAVAGVSTLSNAPLQGAWMTDDSAGLMPGSEELPAGPATQLPNRMPVADDATPGPASLNDVAVQPEVPSSAHRSAKDWLEPIWADGSLNELRQGSDRFVTRELALALLFHGALVIPDLRGRRIRSQNFSRDDQGPTT